LEENGRKRGKRRSDLQHPWPLYAFSKRKGGTKILGSYWDFRGKENGRGGTTQE